MRRLAIAIWLAVLVIAGAGWLGTRGLPAPAPLSWSAAGPAPPGTRFSLFALGDTGERHALPSLTEGQLAVARGLVAHDLVAPVDALLLLGDNFYPEGVSQESLAARVALNLVWPYCRFVALDGERSAEVRGACSLPPSLRRLPAPRLLAVLGDHDHGLRGSADLQRGAIPRLVSSWSVPEGPAATVELAPGLSLVLVDTWLARRPEALAEVTRVLRASPGPWRIVAGHKPVAPREDRPYGRKLRDALRAAGVPVQLYLSGHDHDLRVVAMDPPDPALHVIAGGGATRRPITHHYRGERFARSATGFARVDWVVGEGGRGGALVVSLYETPRYPALFWRTSELAGRWRVGRDGRVAEESGERPLAD